MLPLTTSLPRAAAACWLEAAQGLQRTAATPATAGQWRSFAQSTRSPQDLRVAIVGCGVGGPALALLLKQKLGCTPMVFEAAHAIKEVRCPIQLQGYIPSSSAAMVLQSWRRCSDKLVELLTVRMRKEGF